MTTGNHSSGRSGQAMLIAVLSVSGAILSATTVAGFLLLYQIRATTDSENSAKAIFAADTGVEWSEFNAYCNVPSTTRCATPPAYPVFSTPGVSATTTCYDGTGAVAACSGGLATTSSSISTGSSLNTRRAFYISVTGSTSTYP
jgi:hypothetical protein